MHEDPPQGHPAHLPAPQPSQWQFYGGPPPPSPPPPPPPPVGHGPVRAARPIAVEKGFFAALLDLSFNEFLTTKIVKVVYVVGLVLHGISCLLTFGKGVEMLDNRMTREVGAIAILAALVMLVFGVIMLRVICEVTVVWFRMAAHLRVIADATRPKD